MLGMGRVGRAAYLQLESEYGKRVIGIENREDRAIQLRESGYDVIEGDALDPDLWHQLTRTGELDMAILAMPFHGANLTAMKFLEKHQFVGTVAAVAHYNDEAEEMRGHVDSVFGLYNGAGTALADGAAEQAGWSRQPEVRPDTT